MGGRCGLVSISFRNNSIDKIISFCKKAGLEYIEWGSDVHCPCGDIENAKKIGKKTREAGLVPYCYGSYFRVGVTEVSEFENYCMTAVALGAKCIRLWAYNKKYSMCTDQEISAIENDTKTIFAIAKRHGLCISFEYHRSSLTESIAGARILMDSLPENTLKIHWQPNPEISVKENLKELELLPKVDIVHVFAWTYENGENVRHPLYNHHITWKEYIDLALSKNSDCIFELEFFKDDSEAQLYEDAAVLKELLI